MCHFTARVSSCTGTHVPAGAAPARVHAWRWRAPGLAQSLACVLAYPVSALAMLGQPRCTSRASPADARVLHHGHLAARTCRCVARTRGRFAFPPCCCGADAAGTSPRRGGRHSLLYVVQGLLSLPAHFLSPPSSPLTSLLPLLTNEGPSCLLSPLCTRLSALHGSRADTSSACDGAGRAEWVTCQAPAAFPPFCLSLLPEPGQIPSEFMETIPTAQHQSPATSSLSLCPSPSLLLAGLQVGGLSPSAGVTQPVSGHSSWGSKSLPWGVSRVAAPLYTEPLAISVASGVPCVSRAGQSLLKRL